MFQIQTENEDLKYYLNETSSIVKELNNKDESNKFLRSIYNDIINYLIFLEEKRGKKKSFNQNSLIIRNFCNHIKKYFNFQKVNEKWIFDDWKPEEFKEKCKVDHEQYKALKYSLNHHLTLVNGAPGTGKTYLASQLFEFLIQSGYEHQILVVTYKNVSLDGFLDNIADFLKTNHVDFIRIGGKPRTENLYILQNRFDRQIPDIIIQNKKQYMYLLSFQILINDYLNNQSNNNLIRSIADEIDKLIHINKIMFNDFSFYSEEEELIIKNFFNPVDFIPFGSIYFNCWLFGTDYYESVQQSIKNELDKSYESVFDELKNYFQKGENDPTTEIINEIIKRQFDGKEDEFQLFVNKKKKKIINKDFSLLTDIINNADEGFFNFNDNETDFISDDSNDDDDDKPDFKSETKITSSKLLDYIEYEASMFSEEFIQLIENKFNRLIAKTEGKEESFKKFLIELKEIISTESTKLKEKYENKKKEFDEKEDIDIVKELSTKKLIAMTATRASQYKKYLDILDCQFMIIEEAGELTEPMAFSIIPKTIQNLLMIGDYRQLRPTVEYQLTFKPYNHHISLFEKEVIHAKKTKSDNLFTLSIQRRMHPQISLLLRRIFYSDKKDIEQLNDDESTNDLNKPIGFPNHIQFWLHECTEEMENLKMRSHVNIEEAQICAMLFLMMLCRGYKSSEVTIVPLYKGQKKQIENDLINIIDIYYQNRDYDIYDAFDFEKDLPSKIKVPEDFSQLVEFRKSLVGRYVKCIDDFQGEENEVIILSLTRSEKPGFVKNENRSLVALSRARQMLFVIGNQNVFGMQNEKNPLWQRITAEAFLIDKNSVHFDGIAVSKCPIHNKGQNDEVVIINQAIQFMDNRFNYCQEFCDQNCKCGHKCCLPCHLHSDPLLLEIFERRYYCYEECSKSCKLGHKCQGTCGNCTHNGCPPCSYPCKEFCSKSTCKKNCSLPCCHEGECCCMFKGRCSNCKNEIIGLHTKLMFWNDKVLLCKDCFYKKLNTEKGKKAYVRSSNKDEKFLIYGDYDLDLSDPDDYAEYLEYIYMTYHHIKDYY